MGRLCLKDPAQPHKNDALGDVHRDLPGEDHLVSLGLIPGDKSVHRVLHCQGKPRGLLGDVLHSIVDDLGVDPALTDGLGDFRGYGSRELRLNGNSWKELLNRLRVLLANRFHKSQRSRCLQSSVQRAVLNLVDVSQSIANARPTGDALLVLSHRFQHRVTQLPLLMPLRLEFGDLHPD